MYETRRPSSREKLVPPLRLDSNHTRTFECGYYYGLVDVLPLISHETYFDWTSPRTITYHLRTRHQLSDSALVLRLHTSDEYHVINIF